MPKFYLLTGLFALALFGYAQGQGWNAFDSAADQTRTGSGQGSRIYHK